AAWHWVSVVPIALRPQDQITGPCGATYCTPSFLIVARRTLPAVDAVGCVVVWVAVSNPATSTFAGAAASLAASIAAFALPTIPTFCTPLAAVAVELPPI